MAKRVKVMVAAPNAATNRLLTGSGVRKACRDQASRLYGVVKMNSYRDEKERQPIITDQPISAQFRGTMRSGAVIRGQRYGIRKSVVQQAVGDKVTWK